MKILMAAAHGGFGSESVPLGGGAAIFERLGRSEAFANLELTLIGAGPQSDSEHPYQKLTQLEKAPSSLGTFSYAKFCREFGRETTEYALKEKPDLLLCHDISEGPDLKVLHQAGIKVATIFHVDVVDIFTRLYLKNVLKPSQLTSLYRRFQSYWWPDVLRLVFEQQENVMAYGDLCIVPSSGASSLLESAYPRSAAPILTLGWGVPESAFASSDVAEKADELRKSHQIPMDHTVLLTLSRLSPEKAQDRLLRAVAVAESEGKAPSNLSLVIAGAPAFMEGKKHEQKLRRLASKLRTKVHFVGHVGGLEKAAWYRTADLFVVNSLHESYGLTTLEAMQQACPLVAVESFGTKDTVRKEYGRLVPPGPMLERRLWGQIQRLLAPSYQGQLKSMAEAAQARASSQSFENTALRLKEALFDLV